MKAFKKVLSLGALVALATGTTVLTSCGSKTLSEEKLQELAKTIVIQNEGQKVSNDFKVPSYVSDGKVNVKLVWHSSNDNLLSFKYVEDDPATKDVDESLEDATAVVTLPTDKLTEVTYYATLESGSNTAQTDSYRVRIEKAINAEDTFKKFYDTCASKNTMDIAGYVQVKSTLSSFNNKTQCSLFIQEENGYGGFYAYNCYIEEAAYKALKIGDYVKITGQTSSVYNGIYEACFGNIEVDSSKNNAAVANKCVDLTADLTAGNDILYKQNQIAKVDGVVVSELSSGFKSETGKYSSTMQTLAKFTINSKEYTAVLMEGTTPFADAATKNLYDAILAKIHVGDTINVKGVICGSSFIVTAADDVTFVKASELTDAEKAQKALDSAKKKFAEFYRGDATITLGDGITAVVKSGSTAKVENGKVVITPTDEEVEVVVTLTATSGSESKSEDVTFKTKKPAAVIIPDDALKTSITVGTSVKNKDCSTEESVDLKDYCAFDATIIKSAVVYRKSQTAPNTVYIGTTKGVIDFRIYGGAEMVITLADGYVGYGITSNLTSGYTYEVSADGKTITIYPSATLKFTSIDVAYKAA